MADEQEKTTFYDHFARERPTGLGMWLVSGVSRRILEFAGIEAGSRVLEIGPGRGVFADLCIAKGADYQAIEPNADLAERLTARGIKVTSAIVPPLPDLGQTFDVVVMNSVIEHMNTMMDALALARQIHACLSPGGRFVMYAPDYANWRQHFFIGDFSHSYVTSWRRLEGLLVSAGYQETRGSYQSATFRGLPCLIVSGLAAWLPFAWLDILFPKSRLARKLFKIQIAFMRRVLMMGIKAASGDEGKA